MREEAPKGGRTKGADRGRVRKRRLWVWGSVSAVLLALGGTGVVFLLQALQVRDDLMEAKARLTEIVPVVKTGDMTPLNDTASAVLELTARAQQTVDSPLWDIAGGVPFVGENVVAVSEATRATHVIVRDAMPIAVDLASSIDPDELMREDGGIDIEPLRLVAQKLPEIKAAFAEAEGHIERIDREAVLPLIDDSVGQLVDVMAQAAPLLVQTEQYLPALLTLLGSDESRTYAVLFQNNAESRATGGNPGGGTVLQISDGRVEMREDDVVLDFAIAGRKGWHPQALADSAEAELFEPDTGRYSQNYTRLPDYRDTAALMSGLWTDVSGEALDGVISIDPVMLSYMLAAAGPVAVEGESEPITAENAVRVLLSETYERFGKDGAAADAYFAKVASAVFAKIMSGGWDPVAMIDQVKKGIHEQRLYLWFADGAEQQLAVDLGVDGSITEANTEATQLGIFLNDASYSKLEYYLRTSMLVTCSAEERTVTQAVTLTNSVPSADLSEYTLAWRNSSLGYQRTTMLFDVLSMALPGEEIIATTPPEGSAPSRDRAGAYKGRDMSSLFVAVPMGESRTVSFTSTLPDGERGPLSVRYTPTVTQTPVTIDASCAGLLPEPAPEGGLLGRTDG